MLHRIAFPVVSVWYQAQLGAGGLRVAGTFANQMWQALEGPPNRLGEIPTRGFNLRIDFPLPLTRADIHARLTHVVLTSMRRTEAKGSSGVLPGDPCRMLDTDFEEVPSGHLGE